MTQKCERDGKPYQRILLTGAAGNLGKQLRPVLAQWADIVRVSDIVPLSAATDTEETLQLDLADASAVDRMVEGVDAVIHLGGISVEAPFSDIVQANIIGLNNLYVAAHKYGVKRIVFASSNHVTGFYPVTEVVDTEKPLRPDCLYGVSKCFGEALSRYYFDRFGLQTVCLRIGSSFEAPRNARMLNTFLSYGDFAEIVRVSLFTNRVDHTIVYAVSDNRVKWWSNEKATHLGFRASDSSIPYESKFPLLAPSTDHDDITQRYQGGPFVLSGPMAERS